MPSFCSAGHLRLKDGSCLAPECCDTMSHAFLFAILYFNLGRLPSIITPVQTYCINYITVDSGLTRSSSTRGKNRKNKCFLLQQLNLYILIMSTEFMSVLFYTCGSFSSEHPVLIDKEAVYYCNLCFFPSLLLPHAQPPGCDLLLSQSAVLWFH